MVFPAVLIPGEKFTRPHPSSPLCKVITKVAWKIVYIFTFFCGVGVVKGVTSHVVKPDELLSTFFVIEPLYIRMPGFVWMRGGGRGRFVSWKWGSQGKCRQTFRGPRTDGGDENVFFELLFSFSLSVFLKPSFLSVLKERGGGRQNIVARSAKFPILGGERGVEVIRV